MSYPVYVVNDQIEIKARDLEALMDKCEKRKIIIDVVTLDGTIIADRLKPSIITSKTTLGS